MENRPVEMCVCVLSVCLSVRKGFITVIIRKTQRGHPHDRNPILTVVNRRNDSNNNIIIIMTLLDVCQNKKNLKDAIIIKQRKMFLCLTLDDDIYFAMLVGTFTHFTIIASHTVIF